MLKKCPWSAVCVKTKLCKMAGMGAVLVALVCYALLGNGVVAQSSDRSSSDGSTRSCFVCDSFTRLDCGEPAARSALPTTRCAGPCVKTKTTGLSRPYIERACWAPTEFTKTCRTFQSELAGTVFSQVCCMEDGCNKAGFGTYSACLLIVTIVTLIYLW